MQLAIAIFNYLTAHWSHISFAAYVIIRDWSTIKGFGGLKCFFFTGKTNPPQPEAQPSLDLPDRKKIVK